MNLLDPLQYLPGVGPILAKKLARLELFSVEDLIHHFPFRYIDFSKVSKISDVSLGENVTLKGELWSIKNVYTRFRKVLTKAILNDGSGSVEIVWFNQPWLIKNIKAGDRLQVSGKVEKQGGKLSVVSPEWEKFSEDERSIHTGRLVPIYPETYGLSSKWLRAKISSVLKKVVQKIKDPIPDELTGDLISLTDALSLIHFPSSRSDVEKARERLGFDELFFIQLSTQKKRSEWKDRKAVKPLQIQNSKIENFIKSFPFEFTSSQKKVTEEILKDLKKEYPMNRLLQGEVGSGKTAVSAVAIYVTFTNGLRSFLMAPTEILAFQHYSTLEGLLSPLGVKIGIYTGSRKKADGADVIVGTHALLSSALNADNLGLVIIDEQQRFGVAQRSYLRSKAKLPHFLSMTATPIPRTVALTLYGDLDLSTITEMPKGRKNVKTYVVPHRKREDAYKFIRKKVEEGDQVFVITPLIEELETNESAKAAKKEFESLKRIFPDLNLGLLHGKLNSKEKEEVINHFREGKIDILVSTSVVEVGMDILNATIMVIEGAERFGLAQLHQLRGRVGRGERQSYCLLFCEVEEPGNIRRLKNLKKINNGLELAELDLKIRGSGDIFGERQSGRWDLKIASLKDLLLIQKAKGSVQTILEKNPKLDKYPKLAAKLQELTSGVMPD